jgi:diguanylate cyclase (GGDEF)-like protein
MLRPIGSRCSRLLPRVTEPLARQRILFSLMTGALLAICLIFGSVMNDSRRDLRRQVSVSAANLASAVAHDVDRNIELLDLSIQAVTKTWGNPAIRALAPDLRQMVLFDNALTAQDFGSILVLDQNGIVRADSKTPAPPQASFRDRDYFGVHFGSDDIGLFVSKPFVSRMTGKWAIGLSRRIDNPDGSFGGVVVGTLQLGYLNRLYSALNVGSDGSITLFRTDGTVITREPYVESDTRRYLGDTEGFGLVRSARTGSFEGPSPVDGVDRIISFHRVGKLPLIQDVEVSVEQAYSAWWQKTFILSGVLGLLCLGCLALMMLLYAEFGRRIAMEETLERLASTDALTGVANRRHFSSAFDAEWRRSLRDARMLSLLMIDADQFKAFNDLYGHPAGDELLRSLAACISANIGRPGDLAARYGGEEFAVLLPETDSVGALMVAEGIRCAIEGLEQHHAGDAIARATVSIGVASVQPAFGQSKDDLVAAADAALYQAKADGRNRCCVALPPPPIRAVAA